MNKDIILVMLRRITAGFLCMSIIFTFLPYRFNSSPSLEIIEDLQKGSSDTSSYGFLFLALTVLPLLLAALLIFRSFGIVKCLFASGLSLISAYMLWNYIGQNNFYYNPQIGLILHMIVAISGVVSPLICIVLTLVFTRNRKSNSQLPS